MMSKKKLILALLVMMGTLFSNKTRALDQYTITQKIERVKVERGGHISWDRAKKYTVDVWAADSPDGNGEWGTILDIFQMHPQLRFAINPKKGKCEKVVWDIICSTDPNRPLIKLSPSGDLEVSYGVLDLSVDIPESDSKFPQEPRMMSFTFYLPIREAEQFDEAYVSGNTKLGEPGDTFLSFVEFIAEDVELEEEGHLEFYKDGSVNVSFQ